jgi:hypothetical protein
MCDAFLDYRGRIPGESHLNIDSREILCFAAIRGSSIWRIDPKRGTVTLFKDSDSETRPGLRLQQACTPIRAILELYFRFM